MPEALDRDVLALLEQGDSRGFDLAYARYAERVFGFLLRLSGSRALAEDLFQHTFMRFGGSRSTLARGFGSARVAVLGRTQRIPQPRALAALAKPRVLRRCRALPGSARRRR